MFGAASGRLNPQAVNPSNSELSCVTESPMVTAKTALPISSSRDCDLRQSAAYRNPRRRSVGSGAAT